MIGYYTVSCPACGLWTTDPFVVDTDGGRVAATDRFRCDCVPGRVSTIVEWTPYSPEVVELLKEPLPESPPGGGQWAAQGGL